MGGSVAVLEDFTEYIALDDDGIMWRTDNMSGDWEQLPPLPGSDEPEKEPEYNHGCRVHTQSDLDEAGAKVLPATNGGEVILPERPTIIRKNVGHGITTISTDHFDKLVAGEEDAVRVKLISLGWTPPGEHPHLEFVRAVAEDWYTEDDKCFYCRYVQGHEKPTHYTSCPHLRAVEILKRLEGEGGKSAKSDHPEFIGPSGVKIESRTRVNCHGSIWLQLRNPKSGHWASVCGVTKGGDRVNSNLPDWMTRAGFKH